MARKPFVIIATACVLGLLTMVGVPKARASIVTFSDGVFDTSIWSLTNVYTGAAGTSIPASSTGTALSGASANQQTTGGNPGLYRQVNVTVGNLAGDATYAFSLDNQAVYNPSTQAPITLFTFKIDRKTDSIGQEYGPALLQNGVLYYGYQGSGPNGSVWTSMATPATFAGSNFSTPAPPTGSPNFTVTGSSIMFGFVSVNNTLTNSSFSTAVGYDNWSVVLTTTSTPEPVSMAVISLMTGVLVCRRPSRI